jgi:probable HAF family extracellular repeat protein
MFEDPFWVRIYSTPLPSGDIGTLGGSNGEAFDLSDSGLVVGRADLADGTHHAFVWKNGVITDVGVVPGDFCTNGRAINAKGQAIGTSTDCMGNVEHMFLWENGSIHNLTATILPGSDIDVFEAWDINDRGEIAAVGMLPNGDQHAVLLVPASASEIAAANAINVSHAPSIAVHTFVKNSENSVSSGRNRALNLCFDRHDDCHSFSSLRGQSDAFIALRRGHHLRLVLSWLFRCYHFFASVGLRPRVILHAKYRPPFARGTKDGVLGQAPPALSNL